MIIQKGSKLLMIGDSITDCGRKHPIGEDKDNWGSGYVNMVVGQIGAKYPELKIHIQNMGISGNTVRDLKARWQQDCLDLNPDWLSIMIGINDVWAQYSRHYKKDAGIKMQEYSKTLEELIVISKPKLKGGLILMTPYYLELSKADPLRVMMDQYGAVVKKLAKKHGAVLVDTQAAFDKVMKHVHPCSIATDRIHPFTVGHTILANAFLKGIGVV